jgi:solute carrier family 41
VLNKKVAVLLHIGQLLIFWLWRQKIDPDSSAIPILTALGDLLGTAFLTLAFYVMFFLGETTNTSGR